MSKELIERLRVFAGDPVLGGVIEEAADLIDELERENKRLSDDHYFQACLTRDLMPYQERAIKAEQKCDALQADNARLRESTELLLIARQIGHYRDEWDMLKEALAATPEQSLVEYRNKLIEQMIACYSPDDSAHDYFDKLNALKGQS